MHTKTLILSIPLLLCSFILASSQIPSESDKTFEKGLSNYNAKDYAKAIVNFSKAIELDPKFEDAYVCRADSFYELKKFDEAFADYSKVIEIDPTNVDGYSGRGAVYYEFKKYTLAIADFNKTQKPNFSNYRQWPP